MGVYCYSENKRPTLHMQSIMVKQLLEDRKISGKKNKEAAVLLDKRKKRKMLVPNNGLPFLVFKSLRS